MSHFSARGFSFIEVILVVSIVAIVSLLGSVFYSRYLLQNALSGSVDNLIGQLRKAQIYSMTGRQNSNWGVHFASNTIYLYKGDNFAGRTVSFDETFPVNSNISIAGMNDINFARVSGLPSNGGAAIDDLKIIVTGPNSVSRIVTVNSQGTVEKGDPVATPGVTTTAATNITINSATLNGSANPAEVSTIGWFRYGLTDPGSCNDNFGTRVPAGSGGTDLGSGSTAVNYSENISGLNAGTTYYFCAIANNAGGTSFGSVLSFTTATPITPPSVTTAAETNLAATSATLNGSANPNGDSTTGWFRYDVSNPGSCNDSFGTRAPGSGGSSLGSGSSPAGYSEDISGLSPSTTYYYCAIAANGGGTGIGNVLSFTTPAAVVEFIATTSSTGNNTTSGSFSLPSGWEAGDVAVFWWYTFTNTKTVTPNAAITQKQQASASGFGRIYIGYRRLQSGDTTFGWTSSSSSNSTVIWGTSVFRNVTASGDPFEAQSGSPATFSNTSSPNPPAVTTLSANAMVVPIFGKNNDYSSITVPAGFTSAGSNSATVGNDSSAGAAYFVRSTPGSTDPGVWSAAGASTDDGYVWTGVLKAL